MKNRTCINILLISVLFSSIIFAQEFKIDFPLQIGNRWQYSETLPYYTESRVICDTIMPNNLIYTRIDGVLFNGFFRKEGTKVFSYNTGFKTEFLIYDFSLKVGDTVSTIIYPRATLITTVQAKGVTKIFEQQRNYMTFFRDNINSTADGVSMIVDGLGFVDYLGEVMVYNCNGAVINGVQYGIILDVEKSDKNIPNDFLLFQNYPNPFNPTTTIAFNINKPGKVKINIYDALGNYVTTLWDGYMNTGAHQVIFNGKNLSSGVYFYTMNFNNNIKTKSMILLK
jgi:hypothetical protein